MARHDPAWRPHAAWRRGRYGKNHARDLGGSHSVEGRRLVDWRDCGEGKRPRAGEAEDDLARTRHATADRGRRRSKPHWARQGHRPVPKPRALPPFTSAACGAPVSRAAIQNTMLECFIRNSSHCPLNQRAPRHSHARQAVGSADVTGILRERIREEASAAPILFPKHCRVFWERSGATKRQRERPFSRPETARDIELKEKKPGAAGED